MSDFGEKIKDKVADEATNVAINQVQSQVTELANMLKKSNLRKPFVDDAKVRRAFQIGIMDANGGVGRDRALSSSNNYETPNEQESYLDGYNQQEANNKKVDTAKIGAFCFLGGILLGGGFSWLLSRNRNRRNKDG